MLKEKLFANDGDEDDVGGDSILKIAKTENIKMEEPEKPLTKDQVKFKAATEEPGSTEHSEKPKIEELASTTFAEEKSEAKRSSQRQQPKAPQFDWKTAERVDAKYTFMNQGDLVFVNFNFKGYQKESDIRYALSDNEMLLEVRDVAKNKVHRVCKTLEYPINCQDSSV